MTITLINSLIDELAAISPMPSDDDPSLNVDRLKKYGELLQRIRAVVKQPNGTQYTQLIKPLIHSFGYGDAYEGYWTTLHLLELFPSATLTTALREALQHGERGARKWSALMLGRHRRREDIPLLIAALKDPESEVRHDALAALSNVGDVSALPSMEKLLTDPANEVRTAARIYTDQLLKQHHRQ